MTSYAGHLLIAAPHECDPDFAKAAILVIQHSEEQAVGLVLNRPTERTLAQAWKGKRRTESQRPVYAGGPAEDPWMAVHGCPDLADLEILAGVYYSVQKKNLEKLVESTDASIRFFESHCGWGPGQLERWVDADGWRVVLATPQLVFLADGDLWEIESTELG